MHAHTLGAEFPLAWGVLGAQVSLVYRCTAANMLGQGHGYLRILGIEGKTYLCIVGCLWNALSLHCSSSIAQCTSPLTYTLELVAFGMHSLFTAAHRLLSAPHL